MQSVSLQAYPAINEHAQGETIVLLHGWGSDQRSWQPLLEQLRKERPVLSVELPGFGEAPELADWCAELDQWLSALTQQLPAKVIFIGWSLGGMLATTIASRFPERVSGLVTLASNVKFATDEEWVLGLDAKTFAKFCEGFEQLPPLTLKRFAGLMAHGDQHEKTLLKSLRVVCNESFSETRADSWLQALKLLGQLDLRNEFSKLSVPSLHLFGEKDALVPVDVASYLSELNPRQQICVLPACGHALHWSVPETVLAQLQDFFHRLRAQVDKRRVADSFSRAASKYDSVAALQRQIGETLMGQVGPANVLLDLGAGTGYFSSALKQQAQTLISLDLAEGMLRYAREIHQHCTLPLCGDAENLPLASQTVDGLFSSLAIQWCANLPQLFSELKRITKPGSLINIATLGPRTLFELRAAWQQVDHYQHVNEFAELSALQAAIATSGLEVVALKEDDIVLQYDQLRELTYELKTLGAHNMNQGQSSGLTGRQRVKAFKQSYESFRQPNGKLPATYEVFYLQLRA